MKIFQKNNKNDENIYSNTAFLIFLSGIMFSIGYLLSGIMTPLSSALSVINNGSLSSFDVVLNFSKYIGIFSALGLLLGGLINYLTYLIFSSLTTKLNEIEEIRSGNVGVAILVSIIAIIIAVFCREPFMIVLEHFIPYPEIPIFR